MNLFIKRARVSACGEHIGECGILASVAHRCCHVCLMSQHTSCVLPRTWAQLWTLILFKDISGAEL